jgi:hypothetical protein
MLFQHWDTCVSTGTTNEILLNISSWHCREITDNALSLRLLDAVLGQKLKDLCEIPIEYDRLSISDAYHARQVKAFFEKRGDLDFTGGAGKEEVAFQAFLESERKCKQTNERIRESRRSGVFPSNRVSAVLHGTTRKISRMLGDVPKFSDLTLRFGPGATTQVKRKNASARAKLGQTPTCSQDCLGILADIVAEVPGWFSHEDLTTPDGFTVSVGHLSFVPKNAKTYRSIVVEPMLNSMVQLGLDGYLKDRFERFGLDLRQQSRNRDLARKGSLTGDLATLDLSAASDTISRELVAMLLPLDWFFLLDALRTSRVKYRDEVIHLQKFSSMGNGFTFPLESMIFFALAVSAAEVMLSLDEVSVFGDDIIVGTDVVPLLKECLDYCGFSVNESKSFTSGHFRESCGGDYLRGTDIRPLYIKRPLIGQDAFRLHNFYVRNEMNEPARAILSYIAPSIRKYGPDGYGDGHLLGAWRPRPAGRAKGWSGFYFETFTWRKRRNFTVFPRDHVLPLYSIYIRPEGADNTLHGLMTRASASVELSYDRGELWTTVPGTQGYKLIKVYTLEG